MRHTDSRGRYVAEADLPPENGDTTLTRHGLPDHAARMEKPRRYGRKRLGAAAGVIAAGEVKTFAVRAPA
ncbi:MAG: hypothetical protein LBR93_11815 [Treponema sp.]|nr:hypothetical protein [Treponema sp.]